MKFIHLFSALPIDTNQLDNLYTSMEVEQLWNNSKRFDMFQTFYGNSQSFKCQHHKAVQRIGEKE